MLDMYLRLFLRTHKNGTEGERKCYAIPSVSSGGYKHEMVAMCREREYGG